MLLKKSILILSLMGSFNSFLSNSFASEDDFINTTQGMTNSCQMNYFKRSAWGLSQTGRERMLSDATLAGNLSVSEGEAYERLYKDIKKTYGNKEQGNFIDASSLAKKIQWAASCTGNDFTMLAAIVKGESMYCHLLHNKGGGDSGCGQFTSAAIGFFKNQLRTPGRKEDGHPRLKSTIEEIVSRCAPGSSYINENSLVDLFSLSKEGIREDLRTGKNISRDLLATAIYLKFYYAVSGFYYNASSTSPGALSRYNGGGVANYGTKAYNKAIKIQADMCQKDTDFLKGIEKVACELGDDQNSCQMNVSSILI